MAGRSARIRRGSQDSTRMMRTPERPRRSLSQGDDTPRAAGVMLGTSATPSAAQSHEISASSLFHSGAEHAKRLGFLGEKLLSTTSSSTLRGTPTSSTLPTSRSHSRADSANLLSRETTASPALGMATSSSQQGKGHTSPAKLVTREMHRLGNLAHPPALNPSISTSSNIALSMLPTFLREPDNPWATLYIHILPLFLGEPLRVPIEDLNALVKRHIQSVIPSSPSKALTALESDVGELISNGMLNLASRFREVDDKTLLESVVETWGFFWEQVLPYVEGALLPLQTDSMISSLSRMPKVIKPTSPSGQNGKSGPTYKTQQIDVRTIALQSFRDQIVHPLFPVLHDRLTELREQYPVSSGYQQPRLQHMLLVLVSQRSPPTEQSLTAPPPPPPPGEEAIQILLRTIRTPLVHTTLDNRSHRSHHFGGTGAPSFLSARIPRDRRGRIAHKPDRSGGVYDFIREDDVDGGETPKLGMSFEPAREKEREFLESLKSPGPEGARASMGGWGLGVGAEEKKVEEDDEEENLDWDQAQAVVERMVGMKNPEPSPQPETSRRKLT